MIYTVNSMIYEDTSKVQSRQYDLYRHQHDLQSTVWFMQTSLHEPHRQHEYDL